MRLGVQILICALLAAVPAIALGSIALDQNPQGEFANPYYTGDLYRLVTITWALFALPAMGLVTLIEFARRSDH
jgi:hypothetical protein